MNPTAFFLPKTLFIGKPALIIIILNRVLLSSSVLAIKYNEDDYYANTFYAKVGGISLEELNQLEYDFLSMCGFSMAVKDKKFTKYRDYLSSFT